MIKTLILALGLMLTGCGTDEGGGSNDASEGQSEPSDEKRIDEVELQSISLDSYADLPECKEANKTQLAYVVADEAFYVCQNDWQEVLVKGADGDKGLKGDKGDTGQTSNSSNYWHDSISGKDWLLGGVGTHAQAVSACSGDYRVASSAEGVIAGQHGIRAIAAVLGLSGDFWTLATWLDGSGDYIGIASGQIAVMQTPVGNSRAIFCVKN